MPLTDKTRERTASTEQRTSIWRRLFGKDDNSSTPAVAAAVPEDIGPRAPGVVRRISRKVVPGLPRPQTFRRQQSEVRDRLEPTKPHSDERRAVSEDRRKNTHARDTSTCAANLPRQSAPELLSSSSLEKTEVIDDVPTVQGPSGSVVEGDVQGDGQEFVHLSKDASHIDTASLLSDGFDELITEELERRWILNLSMHFRDKSQREKFFVTFAETPNHWRRVTISLDYRNAPKGSLEAELYNTRFQRDKSARIYEAIRESLPDIQFYDTVTNLKLQTENERLHVHVVEDLSEIIKYPPIKSIKHLPCRRVCEDELQFEAHLSGFVYKVLIDGQVFIKKEIPGPDTVDEFLYEINALHQLSDSRCVIQFGGVVVDNKNEHVKGLLIGFAEQGALIDMIYDGEGRIPWARRERWARQIVEGLSEIHEAGFVQGDFTLSNIVIDGDDNAKIIDINRRGCPVGWEPPEVAALLDSNLRISMYIGVKSDLFQLGMVLYALAIQHDEPENQRPLDLSFAPLDVPGYFLEICARCLNDDPRHRSQAAVLLTLFPKMEELPLPSMEHRPLSPLVVDAHYPEKFYNQEDGCQVISLVHGGSNGLEKSNGTHVYVESEDLASEPYNYPPRGRSPPRKEVSDLHAADQVDREPDYHMGNCSEKAEIAETMNEPPQVLELQNGADDEEFDAGDFLETKEEEAKVAEKDEPRHTEAVNEKLGLAREDELAGIGGAYHSTTPLPLSLDDDLMI